MARRGHFVIGSCSQQQRGRPRKPSRSHSLPVFDLPFFAFGSLLGVKNPRCQLVQNSYVVCLGIPFSQKISCLFDDPFHLRFTFFLPIPFRFVSSLFSILWISLTGDHRFHQGSLLVLVIQEVAEALAAQPDLTCDHVRH